MSGNHAGEGEIFEWAWNESNEPFYAAVGASDVRDLESWHGITAFVTISRTRSFLAIAQEQAEKAAAALSELSAQVVDARQAGTARETLQEFWDSGGPLPRFYVGASLLGGRVIGGGQGHVPAENDIARPFLYFANTMPDLNEGLMLVHWVHRNNTARHAAWGRVSFVELERRLGHRK